MEYEKVYVFKPDHERPAKRRRVKPQGLQTSWDRRRRAFEQAWRIQQQAVEARLSGIHDITTESVWRYLNTAASNKQPRGIPTAIILTGPDGATEASIVKQLAEKSRAGHHRRIFVPLPSRAGTNLKAVLKTIIQRATSSREETDDLEDDDELRSTRAKGPKLLNYDLQVLHDHVRANAIAQVVLAFEDTEAVDRDLLSDLLELLACWRARIPFACLLPVATSVDALQQRLSRAAVRALEARVFDVAPAGEEVEHVCDALLGAGAPLWLGGAVVEGMLERQRDYLLSIESFVAGVKYACMSAYYANALSIFLGPSDDSFEIGPEHHKALRNCDSFRRHARRLLEEGRMATVKTLLEEDVVLRSDALTSIREGQRKLSTMVYTLRAIRVLQQRLPNTQVPPLSALYVQAMSGKLLGSPMLRSLLLGIRKAPSNVLLDMMRGLDTLNTETGETAFGNAQPLLSRLEDLVERQGNAAKPLRSENDLRNSTLRTTVVAQKVELSKQQAALSADDKAYTEILALFSANLEDVLHSSLVDPRDLPYHEVFVYDLKSPYREVFTPRPRHAIERALAAPHDYLDCDCCAPETGDGREEATLAATQPATAVLYQLYLESGSLINASDLWQAFQAVIGDGREEAETMALFQRALAETRYLGMMKTTRKRADHVAKTMWRGL
ncbi:Origin recognition complex subunit 3 [Teratosphaeriaceae sp. CCFEE 6253]|nr:Origin recognition complex subunit 3 [Teratosphaeriaceae sp. CCFEE 6253]